MAFDGFDGEKLSRHMVIIMGTSLMLSSESVDLKTENENLVSRVILYI